MRSEIVEAMRGLHTVGAISDGALEKTTLTLRMLGEDALR
jgi:putative transcriptional regulator